MPCVLHNGQNVDQSRRIKDVTAAILLCLRESPFSVLIFFQIPHTPQFSLHHIKSLFPRGRKFLVLLCSPLADRFNVL